MDTNYRQAVIEAIADTLKYEDYGFLSDELESVINNVLAADVVEVVRCKDCKWWRLSDYNTFGIHVCKKFSGVRGESDFCSRAEPYKGEQE